MEEKARIAVAGALGNLLEWYDFGLYGLLAPILASLFFPGHNRTAALLEVYGGFAAGFAMRPFGAIVLGHLADRVGRRFVLLISVTLMGVATVAVGLLPTWQQAGLWAPVLLMLIRLFQGFSVGGEFVDSVTYLVEAGSHRNRGLAGSIANIGSTAGMLLAAGIAALVTGGSTHPSGWTWRIPFLLGGVIASAAYYFRRHLPETGYVEPAASASGSPSPLRQALRQEPWLLLAALLFTSGYGVVDYVGMVFLPTWAHEFAQVSEHEALRINTAGQALAFFVVPFAAWISDRFVTRRTLLAAAFLAEAALAWEAFRLVAHTHAHGLWIAQLGLACLLAVVMGTAPAMLAEQFAPGYRVSAHALAFNIGIGIVGGTAPMASMALIHAFSAPMAPAVYLIAAALLAFAGALALRERSRTRLDEPSRGPAA